MFMMMFIFCFCLLLYTSSLQLVIGGFCVLTSITNRDVSIFTIHFIYPTRMVCASFMLMEVVNFPSINCHSGIFGVKTNNMILFTLSTEIIMTGVARIFRGSRTNATLFHPAYRTSSPNLWHVEDTTQRLSKERYIIMMKKLNASLIGKYTNPLHYTVYVLKWKDHSNICQFLFDKIVMMINKEKTSTNVGPV